MLLHMPAMVPARPGNHRPPTRAGSLPASHLDPILLERMFDAMERLNPEQRAAVEHLGGPLLVVAGAGSGKTWTLACRVAHLVDRGRPARADPAAHVHAPRRARDALARRAADRRPRARPGLGRHLPRDRQPAAPAPRRRARSVPRLHGPGPDRHGRPDGPDPGRAGVRPGRAAVPAQGHARRHLLAHREQPHQARRRARTRVPVVRGGGRADPHDLRALHRAQARAERARLRRPAPVLGRALPPPRRGPRDLGAVRPHPGRRVPGHQPAPGRHPRVAAPHRRRPDGRGRRRAGDLRVPQRHRRQHPRVPRRASRARPSSSSSATTARRDRSWRPRTR